MMTKLMNHGPSVAIYLINDRIVVRWRVDGHSQVLAEREGSGWLWTTAGELLSRQQQADLERMAAAQS